MVRSVHDCPNCNEGLYIWFDPVNRLNVYRCKECGYELPLETTYAGVCND